MQWFQHDIHIFMYMFMFTFMLTFYVWLLARWRRAAAGRWRATAPWFQMATVPVTSSILRPSQSWSAPSSTVQTPIRTCSPCAWSPRFYRCESCAYKDKPLVPAPSPQAHDSILAKPRNLLVLNCQRRIVHLKGEPNVNCNRNKAKMCVCVLELEVHMLPCRKIWLILVVNANINLSVSSKKKICSMKLCAKQATYQPDQ
jgi:hypothetical protein